MSNLVIALDISIAALKITGMVQEMLLKMESEGRSDLTDEELLGLKSANDSLEAKVLSK